MALGEKAFFLKMDSILNVNLQELDHAGLSEEINEMEKIRLKYFTCATLPSYQFLLLSNVRYSNRYLLVNLCL